MDQAILLLSEIWTPNASKVWNPNQMPVGIDRRIDGPFILYLHLALINNYRSIQGAGDRAMYRGRKFPAAALPVEEEHAFFMFAFSLYEVSL